MKELLTGVEPYSFTFSAFLIGIFLTKELSLEEQGSVGNWLQLVGLTMQTYSSQSSTVNSKKNKEKNNQDDLELVKKAIRKMEEELTNIAKSNWYLHKIIKNGIVKTF